MNVQTFLESYTLKISFWFILLIAFVSHGCGLSWEPSDPGPVNLESSSGHGQEGFQPGMSSLFTTIESLREWKDAPPPHLGHSSIDKEAGDLVALSALFVPVGGWWLQMNSKVLMVNLKGKGLLWNPLSMQSLLPSFSPILLLQWTHSLQDSGTDFT